MNPADPADPEHASSANTVPARRPRRWLGSVVAVAGLALLGGLAWYLTHRPQAEGPGGMPAMGPGGPGGPGGPPGGFGGRGGRGGVTVGVATATLADVPVTLEALGTVTPTATVTVRPQVSGVLTQVLFKEGQLVTKGQLLATIDPRPFELALMEAEGTRLRDQASLENAKLTLQRYQTLLKQDSIARQDVDTQAALVKQLEGTVVSDKAAEGTARLNLGYSRITAPLAGRVGLRTVDAGNIVSSSDTTGVAVITQVAPIDVQFTVPQDFVPQILALSAKATLPVTIYDRTRTTELDRGSFLTLDNLVDTTTGTVKGKARLANTRGLLFPNQFVNVVLQLRTVDQAVVVPVTAVRTSETGDFVYVVDAEGAAHMRQVKRGTATNDRIVIASGLQAGEKVVTEGADKLKDGAKVQQAGRRPGGAASGAPGAWGARGASRPEGASGPWSGASGARHGRKRASDAEGAGQ